MWRREIPRAKIPFSASPSGPWTEVEGGWGDSKPPRPRKPHPTLGPLFLVARDPKMGSHSRSAADNRPLCVCEAGGVYFLDVGLIFQAWGQTEGWPLSPELNDTAD